MAFVCLSISILGWFGCERSTPEELQARANAEAKRLAPVKIPFAISFPSGRVERVRPASVGSPKLMFRESPTSRVFELDTGVNTLRELSPQEWEKATGPISDVNQIGPVTGHPPYNEQLKRMTGGEPLPKFTGQFVMDVVSAPSEDKLAIVSADGKFYPPVTGWIGGHNAYVNGPHFLEIRDAKTGSWLMPAVALPKHDCRREWLNVWWTADERFVVCLWSDDRLMVVPTGFASAPFLVDPTTETKVKPLLESPPKNSSNRDYIVFQPAGWRNEWVHRNTFEVRYESPDCTVLLMSTRRGGSVYRYDSVDQSLVLSDAGAWERAAGPRFGPTDIFPPDPPEPTSEEEERRRDRIIERLNAGLPPEDLPEIDWQVRHCKNIAKTEGKRQQAYRPAPSKRRVLILSDNTDSDPSYFLEFFEPRFCQKVGRTVEMPRATWKELGRMFWLPDCRYVLFENYDRHYFTVLHGDRLLDPHPWVDIGRD